MCVAGGTGWTGSLVVKAILQSKDFELVGVIARKAAGQDIGAALGLGATGIVVQPSLDEATRQRPDVLIDYTKPDTVKQRTLAALAKGVRVIIGTSGLGAGDFKEIDQEAKKAKLGVIACGNFSITAALAKRFSLMAAQHLPSWEIVDYASAGKIDAPSGTVRELAEQMGEIKKNRVEHPVEKTVGLKEARGVSLGGAQVHSVRLPGYVIAFETIFGQPHERLTIRHDAGTGAEPYVGGTLLAAKRVMETTGLVRGLDTLLFGPF